MASLLMKSTVTRGRDEVYVAAAPLRATKGPAQLLTSAAYSLSLWDLQHFMVIIKSSSLPPPHSQALVFDFQPKDPENIYAAVAVLSGKAVPGVVLMRKLSKLPRSKCWFVGYPKAGAIDIACEFNKAWETNLRVGHHDCRDYTNGRLSFELPRNGSIPSGSAKTIYRSVKEVVVHWNEAELEALVIIIRANKHLEHLTRVSELLHSIYDFLRHADNHVQGYSEYKGFCLHIALFLGWQVAVDD